jgi:hypothetical protein
MLGLLILALAIMLWKFVLEVSESRFYRNKFMELVNKDRQKALDLLSDAMVKELIKDINGV